MHTIKVGRMHYQEIADLVRRELARLGTQQKVSVRCNVSAATINLILNNNWEGVRENMWRTVAAALDWRPKGWQVVETANTRLLHQVFSDAKEKSLWIAVSAPAGSSKTCSAKTFAALNRENVFYVECDEWSKGFFLKKFAQTLGISHMGCGTYYYLLEEIIAFFQKKTNERPLIILDQIDKLSDQAMRTLIPLFNGLEDKVGCVIMGVGHIKKRIRRNVENQNCGWDEIESRFGRTYLATPGATLTDVKSICAGNGLEDPATIKLIWEEIWAEEKAKNTIAGRDVKVIKDMRRLKRCIQRELLIMSETRHEPDADAAAIPAEAVGEIAA